MQQAEAGPRLRGMQEVHSQARPERRAENRALLIRLVHACVAAGLALALLLSFWLKPDPRGLGTHEQLLLLPCNFYLLTQLPCPFCGMTTAFAHMARGEVREALLAHPFGALSFVVCALLLPVALGAAISGKNALDAAKTKLPWKKLSWLITAMVVASWIFKLSRMLGR